MLYDVLLMSASHFSLPVHVLYVAALTRGKSETNKKKSFLLTFTFINLIASNSLKIDLVLTVKGRGYVWVTYGRQSRLLRRYVVGYGCMTWPYYI